MQGGVNANGVKVAFSELDSPYTWLRLKQIKDIPKFIDLIAADLDTTVHDPTTNVQTSAPGMIPPPEVQLAFLADLDEMSDVNMELLRTYSVGAIGSSKAGVIISVLMEIPVQTDKTKFRPFRFKCYVKQWSVAGLKPTDLEMINVAFKYAGALNVGTSGASVIS